MATNLDNKSILIVDDSTTVQNYVSIALKSKGFDTIKANNGVDALEKLKIVDVSLIITDINMPYMDGITLINNLRDSEDYKEVPIIILSSLNDEEYFSQGMKSGANSYLVKPFKPEDLLNEVLQVLGID